MHVGDIPDRPRVLIVDDEKSVCDAISSMLGRRGCETATASSGPAALTRLREEYFDVLVCDVCMPGMSGLECLSEALLLDRDLPVLMLTGMNDIGTAREALERGAMDILTKPIELSELENAVRSAARHRRYEIERQRAEQLKRGGAVVDAETFELLGGPLAGRLVRQAVAALGGRPIGRPTCPGVDGGAVRSFPRCPITGRVQLLAWRCRHAVDSAGGLA
jgi:two-component system C4-dicarboxylate transport response regulator DctD